MKSPEPCGTCARIRRVLPIPARRKLERLEELMLKRRKVKILKAQADRRKNR